MRALTRSQTGPQSTRSKEEIKTHNGPKEGASHRNKTAFRIANNDPTRQHVPRLLIPELMATISLLTFHVARKGTAKTAYNTMNHRPTEGLVQIVSARMQLKAQWSTMSKKRIQFRTLEIQHNVHQ